MKKSILILCCIVSFLFGGCAVASSVASAEQNGTLKIWPMNENGMYRTMYVEDEDTGVQYVVVSGYQNHPRGLAFSIDITPRLDSDGSLYVK